MLSNHPNKATPGKTGAVLQAAKQREGLTTALRGLQHLLEEYAPLWYTNEHRQMAEQGLRLPEKRKAKALRALHKLLQQYSPRWYTGEHFERAELALKIAGKKSTSQKLDRLV